MALSERRYGVVVFIFGLVVWLGAVWYFEVWTDPIRAADNCTELDGAITYARRQPNNTEWIQTTWFEAVDKAARMAGEAVARGAMVEALYCDQLRADLLNEARTRLAQSDEGVED